MNNLPTKLARYLGRTNSITTQLWCKFSQKSSTNFHSKCLTLSHCPAYTCRLSPSHHSLKNKTLYTSAICLQKQAPEVNRKNTPKEPDDESEHRVSIFKRFKEAYNKHGKVLIGVHVVTSTVWISVFYYAVSSGVDLIPLLQKLGAADKIIEIANSSMGYLATAYLMYKLATPVRYTVTLFGTYSTVKYLQNHGYIERPENRDNIRSLMKDSRSQMKDKFEDMKDDLKEKYHDKKDDLKEKYQDKVTKKKS